ncbi:MAG: 2-C-methyl-D-erythritol 2,4-cyclodiphosphate synthase [Acidimicrobiia bacterium]|nr:2-C-methyl-D-erythritol 2,4-cyclodiphosphate synthase [Acidimicrobiia bacterium]
MLQRVGQGFDVHRFDDSSDRMLVLGGVAFPGMVPLRGHSDADVIAHACTDAILGAAGLGDIGAMFPDTDSEVAGADSLSMLAAAASRLAEAGWAVTNIDCTVICDEPKIAPNRDEMQQNLGRAVQAPVSVKGKRTEGVAGLGGGIQCHAIAMIQPVSEGGV